MKIITLNLHLWQEKNQLEKLKRVADYINENDIDICFFQEVAQKFDAPLLFDNIREDNNAYLVFKDLKAKYNISYEFKKRGWGIFEEGLAIVSKYPIISKEWFFISKTQKLMDWKTRVILKVTYEVEGKPVHCFAVHMGWSDGNEVYEEQATNLMKEVNKCGNDLVILAGDYNCPRDVREYNCWDSLYSSVDLAGIDTANVPTFAFNLDSHMDTKNKHIDYIFFNKKLGIKEYRVDFKESDGLVSDHYLVYTEI